MPYQLPFGGVSAALALVIRTGQWIGGGMVAIGAGLLGISARRNRRTKR